MSTEGASELERIERRIEMALRDLRIYRKQVEKDSSKGVLGSRGLTQFVIDMLKATTLTIGVNPSQASMTVASILEKAELAGYSIPTARTMSKRLAERQYRVGDIAWSGYGWHWKGVGA